MLCTMGKLASQSLVIGYRKDTDDSQIWRQGEPLWLITTALLKIPVYWHIFNMMSSIYLQEGTHQKSMVLNTGQKKRIQMPVRISLVSNPANLSPGLRNDT